MWWVDAGLGRSFPKDAVPKEGELNTDKFVDLMIRKDSEKPPEEGDWILFGEGGKNAEVENFKET